MPFFRLILLPNLAVTVFAEKLCALSKLRVAVTGSEIHEISLDLTKGLSTAAEARQYVEASDVR